ncbi:MAG: YigZ family protein [Ruminococcus sp.]|nr:YigZ family protein [Ruminococcus sp.]
MRSYKTVKNSASGELTEKRSRFIGYCKPVATEAEAVDFINKIKKEHWDARHNVYAYSLREGQVKRYSDDGEPSGTAGVPVLDVITKNDVVDVVIVVTRYFGGVLLGTGGLVRAYSAAAKVGLEAAGVINMSLCSECEISCTYNQYGKLNTLIMNMGGVVDNCDFADNVNISFHIPCEMTASLDKEFADATAGEVKLQINSEKFFEI